MTKILTCVGTRPNFIKVSKLRQLFQAKGMEYKLLHTGQHFDEKMSDIFFNQLGLGVPDFQLNINASSNNESVGKIIQAMEPILEQYKPDMVIVPGDVNSTFACAFAAASHHIPVGHIEAGLRSFDMTMPEERNRILTDALSDLLFITEPIGIDNSHKAGFNKEKLHLVGNTIVDSIKLLDSIIESDTIHETLKVDDTYCLATFHRPVNVDAEGNLSIIVESLCEISKDIQVVFPIHPRTKAKLDHFKLADKFIGKNVLLVPPLGYIEFLKLMKKSVFIISDSGGVQIESSYFDVPCFTIRERTELLITIESGTNTLVKLDKNEITNHTLRMPYKKQQGNTNLWDGHASERIVAIVHDYLTNAKKADNLSV